jgi:hypothetical protein
VGKGKTHTVLLTFERAEAAEQRLLGTGPPRLNVERELYSCRVKETIHHLWLVRNMVERYSARTGRDLTEEYDGGKEEFDVEISSSDGEHSSSPRPKKRLSAL